MDWKDVAKAAGKIVPVLGTVLAPVTGGVSAGAAGVLSAVMTACGVSGDATPDEVVAAMERDPEVALKLKKIVLDHEKAIHELAFKHDQLDVERERLTIEQDMAALAEVNKTMRAEAKSEHWIQYSWRPLWGIISAGAFAVVCLGVCVLAWRAIKTGDAQFIGTIPMLVGAFTTLFSIPGAILGISAWGRNKLKEKTADNGVDTLRSLISTTKAAVTDAPL